MSVFTAGGASTTGLLSFISDGTEVLSVKTEVSEYMLVQTAEAQSNVLPAFKCIFICERAVIAASMQILTTGRLKKRILDEDFKKALSFEWNRKCSSHGLNDSIHCLDILWV